MAGKMKVEAKVSTVNQMVSKSVGGTYWKIISCKDRTKLQKRP